MDKKLLRERLAKAKLAPKKGLGQNFLIDDYYLQKIVDSLSPEGDFYLEIGGGPATLSEKVVKRGLKPYSIIELDDGMVALLQEMVGDFATVLHQDAAKMDIASFGQNGVLFGNLPYNLSSRILIDSCVASTNLHSAVFLLQEEVAEKCVAQPGERGMGPLSALLRLVGTPELLFSIPPESFFPAPKVTSALLSVDFHKHNYSPNHLRDFVKVVRIIFSNRRKKLGNVMKIHNYSIELLEKCGISPSLRSEQLEWSQLVALANALSEE
ncbi:ribosomal RNA small subunit methyltransferase A [bacterium]|nr:ribosomal RNA small subunit methyltransferase A [bacterium]